MNTLDYVILVLMAVSLVVGIVKGLIKQLLAVGGVIVITTLTATVTPYVQTWIAPYIESESLRAAIALFGAVILLSLAYCLLGWVVGKMLKKITIVKLLDRVLGGVAGIVVVYLVFAVVFALLTQTGDIILPNLKSWLGESIETSWLKAHVYKHNFFGNWVIVKMWQRLVDGLAPSTEALARVFVSSLKLC